MNWRRSQSRFHPVVWHCQDLGYTGEANLSYRPEPSNHHLWLNKQLLSTEFVAEFLNAAMEDDDPQVYLLAIRKLIDARCDINAFALQHQLSRETLNRELAGNSDLTVETLNADLKQTGLKLCVEPAGE